MGDRVQIGVKQPDGATVYVYAHWDGQEAPRWIATALGEFIAHDAQTPPAVVAASLVAAVLRAAVDESPGRFSESGNFGVGTVPMPQWMDHPTWVVDPAAKTVTRRAEEGATARTWSFAVVHESDGYNLDSVPD